jgi:hypothetical protein
MIPGLLNIWELMLRAKNAVKLEESQQSCQINREAARTNICNQPVNLFPFLMGCEWHLHMDLGETEMLW